MNQPADPAQASHLPQTRGDLFITDGGLETTLIFHDGMELPGFAAFPLLANEQGRQRLTDYSRRFLDLAEEHGLGFILESATWSANPDRAVPAGYKSGQLAEINRRGIEELVNCARNMPAACR